MGESRASPWAVTPPPMTTASGAKAPGCINGAGRADANAAHRIRCLQPKADLRKLRDNVPIRSVCFGGYGFPVNHPEIRIDHAKFNGGASNVNSYDHTVPPLLQLCDGVSQEISGRGNICGGICANLPLDGQIAVVADVLKSLQIGGEVHTTGAQRHFPEEFDTCHILR